MKLTDAEKCANLGTIKIKNKKSMSKESTFGMIPALKDKSIERDFRTLKRDRLVADIPMWDSCFFVLKDRIVKAGAD